MEAASETRQQTVRQETLDGPSDGSQSGARGRARHRSRRHCGLRARSAAATNRRPTRPPSKPCARRSTSLRHRRHGRDRRRRARRSADALSSARRSAPAASPVDIALDPLEGTTLTAKALPNALAVIAMAEHGHAAACARHLYGQDRHRPGLSRTGVIDLDADPADNILALAKAKGVEPSEITACVLDRPRHAAIIARIRKAGAAVQPDHRRRHRGRDRHHRSRRPASTSIWARAARRKACWRRRHCAASADRCRRGSSSRTTTNAPAPRVWASPISTANTRCSIWPRATCVFAATGVTDGSMLTGVHAPRRLRHHRKHPDAFGHAHGALDQGAASPPG